MDTGTVAFERAVIEIGAEIGEGAIVGCGAVGTKSVPLARPPQESPPGRLGRTGGE